MMQNLVVHGLTVAAAAYLLWRLIAIERRAKRQPGCGSCPSCSDAAVSPQNPRRDDSVTVPLRVGITKG